MSRNRILALILLSFFAPVPLYAHRMSVFTYPEGDRIHVESYFSRGANCMGCLVEVIDSAGTVVASGTTTEEGKWSFVPPDDHSLTVAVTASEGHRAEYTLSESDYPETSSSTPPVEAETEQIQAAPLIGTSKPSIENQVPMNPEDLEAIIDRALEKKLAPIREELRRMQVDEPGFQEIVAGIGYLFGLCGVAMYFISKRGRSV